MQKRTLVEFDEQSKAVVAKVTIEYIDNVADSIEGLEYMMSEEIQKERNQKVLKETKELFDEAQKYALEKTFSRRM